ncbi:glycosyltransferase family 9 protein [Desulfovulcanus sp.]
MRKNKNVLVINLTRFGDLLQTQPVFSGYKQKGYNVGLVCLENFAGAACLLQDVDYVFPLPGAKFLSLLDNSWPQALKEFYLWVKNIVQDLAINLIVNLTPSISARLLSRLFPGVKIIGFGLDEFGFGYYSNNWAAFLQASSKARGCSPFNLVDIQVRAAELEPEDIVFRLKEPEPGLVKNCRENLKNLAPEGTRGFIGFQLGASDDKRRWPVAHFVQLAELLWPELKLCPLLFGAGSEKGLANRFKQMSSGPYIDLIGQTDLLHLAGYLRQCEMLVTNDTGTMHLAAGLGVPIVAFFLATAQPWDTGPYLENCLCLEPKVACHPCSFDHVCEYDFKCRKTIGPVVVFKAIETFLKTKFWPEISSPEVLAWRTMKENCFMGLERASDDLPDRIKWMYLQRHFYASFLDNRPYLPPDGKNFPGPETRQSLIEDIAVINSLLEVLTQQGRVLLQRQVKVLQQKFMQTWQRLGQLFEKNKYFPVLGSLWVYQSQGTGHNLEEFLRLCFNYSNLLTKMYDFLSLNRGTWGLEDRS